MKSKRNVLRLPPEAPHLFRETVIGLGLYGAVLAGTIVAILLGVPWWIATAASPAASWVVSPIMVRRLRRAGERDRAAIRAQAEHELALIRVRAEHDRALIRTFYAARHAVVVWLHLGGKSFHA